MLSNRTAFQVYPLLLTRVSACVRVCTCPRRLTGFGSRHCIVAFWADSAPRAAR